MQEQQHITKNSNNNPSTSRQKSILSRTAITQIETDFLAPLTQQDIESQQYQQDRFEATKLEIQAKYGTITPLGQERLTLLQAKKAEFWQRYLGNTRRNSRDFSMIPVHRKEVSPIQAIQAKLTIGAPGDKYEQEADRVAAQVVNQINAPVAQQESQNLQHETQAVEIQKRPWLRLQAKHDSMAAPVELESSIQQARSGGQSLMDNVRQPMERAFGADFSGVKVHTDRQSDHLNQSIQARAFTTGHDVFFRQGEYNPGSRRGQELIAHELTHVVQQNGGAVQRSPSSPNESAQHPDTETDSSVITSDQLAVKISEKENGLKIDKIKLALEGILGDTQLDFPIEEKDLKPIIKNVQSAIQLYERVKSILDKGILTPTTLKQTEVAYTPSSDSTAQDKISMFDINLDRTDNRETEERFPKPGHASIGPVLERQDDYNKIVGGTYRAAIKNNPLAITQFNNFIKEFPDFFATINEAKQDNVKEIMEIMTTKSFMSKKLDSLFMAILVNQPHVIKMLEERASKSAMFISTGKKLDQSSLAEELNDLGPKVKELRTSKQLKPSAISHVLLPEYMKGFIQSLQTMYSEVDLKIVGNIEETEVLYYNEQSRTSRSVKIKVPNYQHEIDSLITTGNRKMLTHISNIN